MIDERELRVGNMLELLTNDTKFHPPTGRNVSVTEIRTNRIQVRMKSKLSENEFTFIRRFETLKPIPLTEKLLNRNGIFNSGMRKFIIPNCKFFLIEWEQLDSCKYVLGMKGEFGDDEIISEPFSFVHELQNILFFLNRMEFSLI